MKKLLIATAALAMVAGTAQAQSSVTVYGIIDTGYNSLETTAANGTKSKTTGVQGVSGANQGESASSRLGFRGTEDLGGGVKANFVVEGNMRQSTGLSFDRAYWVGLEDAKMGQLRVGFQDSFVRSVWLGNDQLAAANVVGNLVHDNTTPMTGASGVNTQSHVARNTAINYISPRINGFQGSLGLTQSNVEATGVADTKNGTGMQIGLNYAAGNLSVSAAQVTSKQTTPVTAAVTGSYIQADGTVSSNVSTSVLRAPVTAVTTAFDTKTKDTAIGANYKLGDVTLAYIYMDRDIQNGVQRTANAFSASYPLTAKLVGRIGYGYGDYAASPTAAKYDIKGAQAALNYSLSKRTMAYAIYGDEKRDSSAGTLKAKEYSVGVRHSF
jgi:predicted porin